MSRSPLNFLYPDFAEKVQKLISKMSEKGFPIRITSGLRTFAEQDALYAQGRTKDGKRVTSATGGYSYHNYGLAVDVCFLGKEPYPEIKEYWDTLGQCAKELGLTWGGDFKHRVDRPHVQNDYGVDISVLFSLAEHGNVFSVWTFLDKKRGVRTNNWGSAVALAGQRLTL